MKNLLRRGIIRTINRFKIDENNRLFDVVSPFVRFITFIFFYLFFYIFIYVGQIYLQKILNLLFGTIVIGETSSKKIRLRNNHVSKTSHLPNMLHHIFSFFLFFFTPEQIPAFFFYSLTKYVFFVFLFRDAHFPLYFSRGR